MTGAEVFNLLISHGASVTEATVLTAVSKLESGWNPEAYHSGSGASGLFQHLAKYWPPRAAGVGMAGASIFDPVAQVKATLSLFRSNGLQPWAVWPGSTFFQGTVSNWNKAIAEAINVGVSAGFSVDSSAVSTMASTGASTGASGAAPAASGTTPAAIPDGYTAYKVGSTTYVVYEVDGGAGATSAIVLKHEGALPGGGSPVTMSQDKFAELVAKNGWVDVGTDTSIFTGISPNESFQTIFERVLFETGMAGSSALADQGVMSVLAMWIARPDMTEGEFMNRLRLTDWWDTTTEKERAWNDLSEADQELAVLNAAAQIAGLAFTYAGVNWRIPGSVAELQKSDPGLYEWAKKLASGLTTEPVLVNSWLKAIAEKDPESPWSRSLRAEEQARGQFTSQVENMAERIRSTYADWGVPISKKDAMKLANDVVMNRSSEADYMETIRKQALVMYPTKPVNVSTRDWASPYTYMYQQLMEQGDPGLMNKHIQKALTTGMNVGDFATELRKDRKWQDTKNARDEYMTSIFDVGRMMGFE